MPSIAVIIGSQSDEKRVESCVKTLRDLGVDHELRVLSAHRDPEKLDAYIATLEQRGVEVIIAAAGLSAALPGAIAARTKLPVVGLPLDAGTLGGLDALLSIVQMPKRVPVATVGINNGANAALLALRILAIKHDWAKKALESV